MALTVGLTEAKTRFSEITETVNRTGEPVTVFKKNKPWAVICPASSYSSIVDIGDIKNPETIAAINSAEQLFRDPSKKMFTNVEDFFEALEKDTGNA